MPAGSNYCIAEGMIQGPLRNIDLDGDGAVDHVAFFCRNQFLHPNHPLGWIRKLTIAVDGETLPVDRTVFGLRGQKFAMELLPSITDVWWNMGERASLFVRMPPLATGSYRVVCSFDVSLFVHTPNVDVDDLWPTLRQDVSAELICAA